MEIKRTGNAIEWNKVSLPLEKGDYYIFSPVDKNIYVLHNTDSSVVSTVYNRKGAAIGNYEYKNCHATRLFIRAGFANMVYCHTEDSGNKCWYQARLLNNGFCTELYALHRTDSEGKAIEFIDDFKDSYREDA